MKLLELTSQQIIDLYKKHKLLPEPGSARVRGGCTCAIGVLSIENGTQYESGSYASALPPLEDIGDSFDLTAFAMGFDDGLREESLSPYASRFFKKGHEIGCAVRQAQHNGEFK